jgi:hypothetical protein
MMQHALRTIGEAIIEDAFESEYEPFYTASPISGADKAIQSVVVVRFERIGSRIEYVDTRVIDPEASPQATAARHGYVRSSNVTDNSVTKRASANQPVEEKLSNMLDRWFDEAILGDELLSHPIIGGIHNITGDEIGETREQIEHDIDNIVQQVDYRAFLTMSVIIDGEERFAGELDVFNDGMKRWVMDDTRSKSSATDCYGFARCHVCDEQTECFGLGAKMGEQYVVKQQWPFPGYNSSAAWRSRPLCIDCITAIEVAADRFLEPQDYGVPGMQCRVIPYTLPIPGATEQLKTLIRDARLKLIGADPSAADSSNGTDDEENDAADEERPRPLAAAWDRYRQHLDTASESDGIRLAFSHIVRDSNKTHGIAWIDGVSVDQVEALRNDIETLIATDPVFEQGLLPQPDPPTERQLFSGMWLFNLLAAVRGSNHRGEYIGDETPWVDYTEQLLVQGTITHDDVITAIVREARARYRKRLGTETDFPYDGFHLASAYVFLRVAATHDILQDNRTNGTRDMTIDDRLDDTYTTFGDGIEAFVTAHPSIDDSPGRTAAFVLGAVAAQLSNWQQYRGLSKTFLQNRDIDQLTVDTLTRWQTDIWEKAKVYNAQEGNYGVPWSEAWDVFHDAILAGENEDWKTTANELQYPFLLGTQIGPSISQRATENRERNDADTSTADSDDPAPNAATDASPPDSTDDSTSATN